MSPEARRYVPTVIIVVIGALIVFASCKNSPEPAKPQAEQTSQAPQTPPGTETSSTEITAMAKSYPAPPEMKIDVNKSYTATIETDAGTIVAELDPKIAPKTVNSFVFLARDGYYNGVIFHRVIPGFMIQGGDPTGTGSGGPGYKLPAEFNSTKHDRGVLSMARTADPNSAGSQFFIMHARYPSLDNQYTVFGKAVSGLEVIDKIVNAPTGANDRPLNPVKIKSIKIDEK